MLTDIIEKKVLDDDLKGRLRKAIESFKKKFVLDPSKASASSFDEEEAPAEEADEAPKAKKAKKSKKGE